MPTYLSLIRGINVAGHRTIRMDELRALYDSLGFREIRSYIQSGNLTFQTEEYSSENWNNGSVKTSRKRSVSLWG